MTDVGEPNVRIREGRQVIFREVGSLVAGDLVQFYSTWDQTHGDPIRRRIVKVEVGPDVRVHEHVLTLIDPRDPEAEPYDVRKASSERVDLIAGTPPRDRDDGGHDACEVDRLGAEVEQLRVTRDALRDVVAVLRAYIANREGDGPLRLIEALALADEALIMTADGCLRVSSGPSPSSTNGRNRSR